MQHFVVEATTETIQCRIFSFVLGAILLRQQLEMCMCTHEETVISATMFPCLWGDVIKSVSCW